MDRERQQNTAPAGRSIRLRVRACGTACKLLRRTAVFPRGRTADAWRTEAPLTACLALSFEYVGARFREPKSEGNEDARRTRSERFESLAVQ
ncbi:hypothetical protein MTO96_021105 [Rhipicephalus appendiculatus]